MAGRDDLARKMRWVSDENGDGARYDIASFTPAGLPRLIEVMRAIAWERTPFHITRNELAVAEERRLEWSLFRLWDFPREPTAFDLHPPLDPHAALTATTFQASFLQGAAEHPHRFFAPRQGRAPGPFQQGRGGHLACASGAIAD